METTLDTGIREMGGFGAALGLQQRYMYIKFAEQASSHLVKKNLNGSRRECLARINCLQNFQLIHLYEVLRWSLTFLK